VHEVREEGGDVFVRLGAGDGHGAEAAP